MNKAASQTETPPPRKTRLCRFAPSPNGYLHLGHAYSALLNQKIAKQIGARFELRIEDIDFTRAKPHFIEAIYEDLQWLGVEWASAPRRQSQCSPDYLSALERLQDMNLLYPCFCSRSDILRATQERPGWPRDPDGAPLYPQICRDALPDEEKGARRAPSFRLKSEAAYARMSEALSWREYGLGDQVRLIEAGQYLWGDCILARADIGLSYHLCVVVDDALQGVTDIVRGSDLFASTALHRLLQELLGFPAPNYRHHPLVCDAAGAKLAKSQQSKPLRQWRAEGFSPRDIRAMLGFGDDEEEMDL